MTEDKTWNVFIDGVGILEQNVGETTARKLYSRAVDEEPYETVELVHNEQTVARHN